MRCTPHLTTLLFLFITTATGALCQVQELGYPVLLTANWSYDTPWPFVERTEGPNPLRLNPDSLVFATHIPENVRAFIRKNLPAAKKVSKEYGVNTTMILTVAALESGWGSSQLARLGNNFFGIKAFNWSGPVLQMPSLDPGDDGKLVKQISEFRRYVTPEESFEDFAKLMLKSRYREVFKIPCTDFARWAQALQHAQYSLDSEYAEKLQRIVNKYNMLDYCN